ncbi:MAG: PAS domain S-box protein [Desulfotomaculaceae bacterium]|nr:PAS domain S-box protein [Desulfotomaculaceae bacterium]
MDIGKQDTTSLIRFFEISRDVFFIVNENLIVTYVNPQIKNYVSIKREEIIGRALRDLFSNYKEPLVDEKFYHALNVRVSQHWEMFSELTDRWMDVSVYPLDNGGLAVSARDITEKKQLAEALHKSEERYKAFIAACFDIVYLMSPDWGQMHFLKGKEVLADTQNSGSNWMGKYIHPDDRPYVSGVINDAILNKSIFDLEHQVFKEDGSLGWVHSRAIPIMNDDGDIVEWLGAASDITVRKECEIRLIEKEKEYLETLDASSIGSTVVNFEKKECHISETWKKRLGLENLSSKEIFAEPLKFFHPEDAARIAMYRENSVGRKESKLKSEYWVKTVDSGYIWVLGQTKVIYNKAGKAVKSFSTHIDITDRKQAEDALKESERKARELVRKLHKSNENKSNFISTLSHELRNPLAVIAMGLDFLEHVTPGAEKDIKTRGVIKRQTALLVRLVDDLLDISRISRNKIELKKGVVEVNRLVEETLGEFRDQFNDKGVILEGEYFSNPLYVHADSVRMKQVIGNLLSNSLKFTGKDEKVRLTVAKDIDANDVVIKAYDTGIGIAPELLPDLFEPFVQADNLLARSSGGLGLGLSIVKGIVDLHGGSIMARSEGLGKGAELTVRLPLL